MTQGREPNTPELFNSSRDFCDKILPETSIYRLLYEHGDAFFPDAFFEDLFSRRGRQSVPPRIVATVMVLQRLEGLSDREAVERFTFDARCKIRLWRARCKLSGVRAHRAGGDARAACPLGEAAPNL